MKENEADKNRPPGDPDGIDQWLREQLGPSIDQANRVVIRALAAERSSRKPGRIFRQTAAAATAGLCVIAVILVLIFGQLSHHRPQPPVPSTEGNPSIVATITNESGPVELRLNDEVNASLAPGMKKTLPSESSIQIFNQDGLVAAEVVDGGVSYLVIGGDE
jgi:hypothetical protein